LVLVDALSVLVGVRLVAGLRLLGRPSSPAELARQLDPTFKVTPTIRLLSDAAVRSITRPDQRDVITTPPRTGKSQLMVIWTAVWALMRDPDMLIVVAAYADDLAQEHSRKARRIIQEHHEFLGLRVASDKSAVGRWTVEGRRGGMLAAGILSGITGMGADLLLVDDPVKNMQEADSAAYRRRVVAEFRSTLMTRLHPGGSAVVIQTRWHELDLAGVLLGEEAGRWRHVNVPAIAAVGVPDALGRSPGVAMVSALGRSAGEFVELRRQVGERTWWALFQGVPSAPEGGLVKRDWFDCWRLRVAPQSPVRTVVGVDPSDSGSGDSCGIVAASLSSDGVVAVIADVSAPMTSDEWAREAVGLAVAVGASEIAVEGFAARETYLRVVREALGRAKLDRPIVVSSWPPKGRSRVGDAVARSASLLQGLEVGTVRVAGHLPEFESAAIGWQSGQHQPDSLAALVVAHDVLVSGAGRGMGFSGVPAAGGVAGLDWMRRRVS
jgi:hypothetical protein